MRSSANIILLPLKKHKPAFLQSVKELTNRSTQIRRRIALSSSKPYKNTCYLHPQREFYTNDDLLEQAKLELVLESDFDGVSAAQKNQNVSNGFALFILSRESGGGAMRRTNSDALRGCLYFHVFRLNFASDFFNLQLAGFHQAEIIIVKHLIQGRNNETRLGVEPLTLRSWSS